MNFEAFAAWGDFTIALTICAILVLVTTSFHYEALRWLAARAHAPSQSSVGPRDTVFAGSCACCRDRCLCGGLLGCRSSTAHRKFWWPRSAPNAGLFLLCRRNLFVTRLWRYFPSGRNAIDRQHRTAERHSAFGVVGLVLICASSTYPSANA